MKEVSIFLKNESSLPAAKDAAAILDNLRIRRRFEISRDGFFPGQNFASGENASEEDECFLSVWRMPDNIPVSFAAAGKSGAVNAALGSLKILSLFDKKAAARIREGEGDVISWLAKNAGPTEA